MNKPKYFIFIPVMTAMMLLVLGNWVTPVQANNTGIGTPASTGTPIATVTAILGEIPSAGEQEELKAIIQSYVELRYRALSVSDAQDFKQNGFSSLVSETPEAGAFLSEEMGKLAIEIKQAELDQFRYVNHKVFLNFRSITIDPATQVVTILAIEGNEVVYEISAELNPENPVVSHTGGIEHTILLHKEQNRWKIISDTYNDDIWQMLRQAGSSTDDTPTHPAAEAMFAVIETTLQSVGAFQNTDATFHSRMPLASIDKPLAAFKRFALFGLIL